MYTLYRANVWVVPIVDGVDNMEAVLEEIKNQPWKHVLKTLTNSIDLI